MYRKGNTSNVGQYEQDRDWSYIRRDLNVYDSFPLELKRAIQACEPNFNCHQIKNVMREWNVSASDIVDMITVRSREMHGQAMKEIGHEQ